MKKAVVILVFISLLAFSILSISILTLDDSFSKVLRGGTEKSINSYIENMTDKAFQGRLSVVDKSILNMGILTGIVYSRIHYPEASALLYHYVYGDGSDLVLDSAYFQKSHYLQNKIILLSLGDHGPIAFKQHQDWRLSLTLNPYHLNITKDKVRLYHPNIRFAPLNEEDRAFTIVPIGKMRLRVYDNLISAMNPRPFYAYSEWSRSF